MEFSFALSSLKTIFLALFGLVHMLVIQCKNIARILKVISIPSDSLSIAPILQKCFCDRSVFLIKLKLRFTEKKFKTDHMATLGVDFKIKTLKIEDKLIKF